MPPVEESLHPLLHHPSSFPQPKDLCRVGGEGGPLGRGRCSTSLYKEDLVRPKEGLNLSSFVDGSVSSLLEHCLGWEPQESEEEEEELPGPLLPLLTPLTFLPLLPPVLSSGCDPNLLTSRGRAALHLLLAPRDPPPSPHLLLPATLLLLEAGATLDQRDSEGTTPLLSLARLLELRLYKVAAEVATLLLSRGCDVNAVNSSGRSLLSYTVTHLEAAVDVTRVLVNHGARVWPRGELCATSTVAEIRADREESAFTWFLRAVVSERGLADTDHTLDCLCHEMGRQPARMKAHVLRVMVSEGRYPRVLGPVFLQLKLAMAPFWSEPQDLRYLAWNSVRRSLGPKRLEKGSSQLGLPRSLTQYLTLRRSNRPRFQ